MVLKESAQTAREMVGQFRELVEEALGTLVPQNEPASLYEPARYVLSGGGKRLRPVLLLLTAKAFDVSPQHAMPAALAVEVFHNFTLVHDDIMDNAATRRGKPTVHTSWDESTAILSGDYMMGLSFDLLSRTPVGDLKALLNTYHHMVRLLCEGQALDKEFETRDHVTVDEYIHMIDGKTAALLATVFELGGIIGDVGSDARDRLRLLGESVGRAFQIQDDLLDITAKTAKWGKMIGGDLVEGKKTYLLLRAIASTDENVHTFFSDIVTRKGLPVAKIPEARKLLEESGILEDAKKAVLHHTRIANECLDVLGESEASNAVRWLVSEMQNRIH